MRKKPPEPDLEVFWPPPDLTQEPDPGEKILGYARAIIQAGAYLDHLADKGDRKANRITEELPEEYDVNRIAEDLVRRTTCMHPKSQRRELRGGSYTSCLRCRQVLRYPVTIP